MVPLKAERMENYFAFFHCFLGIFQACKGDDSFLSEYQEVGQVEKRE